MTFHLDERLKGDTYTVQDLPLCRLLLMDDRRFPWLVLVPRRDALRDLHDVAKADKGAFFGEIDLASTALKKVARAEKMNVAALGNMVPQLHVHVIARFKRDACWPRPVWGEGTPVPYAPAEAGKLIDRLKKALRG